MKLSHYINLFENKIKKSKFPNLRIGNRVRIGIQIAEGDKTRIQFFEGIIIAQNKFFTDSNITVRKIFQGIGVERTIPLNSYQIKSIIVLNSLKAKRAKLFYLRSRIGKAATRIQKNKKFFQVYS
nr:ribosomal protein L19 [Ostreobium quekettii]